MVRRSGTYLLRGFTGLAAIALIGSAAQAAQTLTGTLSASDGVITAGVTASGVTGLLAGSPVSFDFFTPTGPGGSYITVPAGQFSGSLTTSTNSLNSASDFDFGTISFINAADNSIHYDFANGYFNGKLGEMSSVWTSLSNPAGIIAGDYFLRITGVSRGNGSFGGQLTFNPLEVTSPVPEAATWMLMVVGFGMMGMAMRQNRRPNVSFA